MRTVWLYDALDRRIGINDNSLQTWTVFDGSNPYADFNASGSLATRYLSGRAIDEIFARTSVSGTSAWYLTDNLGSMRDVVSSSGAVLDHIAYDSFGNVSLETSASSGDRFKYAGLQWDGAAGLYLSVHRPYDASPGRWVSQDPIGFYGLDSNIYRYVQNTVSTAIDPNGTQKNNPDGSPKEPGQNYEELEKRRRDALKYKRRAKEQMDNNETGEPDTQKSIQAIDDISKAGQTDSIELKDQADQSKSYIDRFWEFMKAYAPSREDALKFVVVGVGGASLCVIVIETSATGPVGGLATGVFLYTTFIGSGSDQNPSAQLT